MSTAMSANVGAEDSAKITAAINGHSDVEALIHIRTVSLGPDELLVGARVAFGPTNRLSDVAYSISSVKAAILAAVPAARTIFIEPDVYVAPGEGNPPTESIVIRSAD